MNKNLKKYQEKRDFEKTKEPAPKKTRKHKKLRFVVQHHLARRDHYDLRLEWNGTLKSWAVPKGPSYNPKDRRLAVQVEDHPFDYRNFEGTIPKGQYGGGAVMIFDEGYWEPQPKEKLDFDKSIKFTLHGSRLKGNWALVHMKDDNWLLLKEKEKDHYVNELDIKDYKTSIRTGRTMKEIEQNVVKKKTSKKDFIVEGVEISNPQKLIFPNPKVTKFDIVLYYQTVARRMLPFLNHRLISTVRCPSGITGDRFFKKHLETKSDGIARVHVPSDKDKKTDYYYIKDISGLISEVQMNSYEFHIWGCKANKLSKPDMLVFDLDPDENMSLDKVREGVKDLKSILDELHLVSFLKTSGGKGYHVVVPIQSLKSWTSFRKFAKNIAEIMEMKWPQKYVSNMRLKNRKGKIFIDWVRNTKMATSVAPYSIRVKKTPSVSMPISWRELDKVSPNEITMKDAIQRLKRKDPWENFFDIQQ